MNINEISKLGANNIQVVVSLADLNEFFEEKISEAVASRGQEKEEKYLSVDEVCEALKVSSNTLWRWNKNGYLKPNKVGRKSVYLLSDIDRLRKNKRA
jgi:excisionase family DNA binding protein